MSEVLAGFSDTSGTMLHSFMHGHLVMELDHYPPTNIEHLPDKKNHMPLCCHLGMNDSQDSNRQGYYLFGSVDCVLLWHPRRNDNNLPGLLHLP